MIGYHSGYAIDKIIFSYFSGKDQDHQTYHCSNIRIHLMLCPFHCCSDLGSLRKDTTNIR